MTTKLPRSVIDRIKSEIIEELETRKVKFDQSDVNDIVSQVQSRIQVPKFDQREIINALLLDVKSTEDEKRIDFYRDEVFTPEIKTALSKQVLDQIELPEDGEPGPPGEKGEPGKDAQPLPLTEIDKKEIAALVDVSKLIKDRKQDLVLLVEQLKTGKIKLPSHAGIDVKEIINEISKILGNDDWKSPSIDISNDGVVIGRRDNENYTTDENITVTSTDDAGNDRINTEIAIVDNPNFDSVRLNTGLSAPAYEEGVGFYDNDRKAWSYYNDEQDVTVNSGQELLIPVRNETGAAIPNGKVVYPIGESGGKVLIDLADARRKDKTRFVGVTTHSIENNSNGYVTRLGEVADIDTTTYTTNPLYLSTDGNLTSTRPDDGVFPIIVAAKKIDGVNGSIVVDPSISELTVEVTDTNGFPSDQRTNTSISFDNGTRTFTVSASSYPFHYYVLGEKFEKDSSESIAIPDTEGLHVFYYDGSTLTTVANPNDGQIDSAIRTKSLIAYIYWDATNSEQIYLADERHGISMAPVTHSYLHFTRGAQFLSGIGIGDLVVDGNGSLDTHAQFSVESGFTADEDLITSAGSIGASSGLLIYALEGSQDMRRHQNVGFSVLTDNDVGIGTTGRLVYNSVTGGTWGYTVVPNNDFVLCHVFSINGIQGTSPVQIAVMGQAFYANAGAARAGASTEIASIIVGFLVEESVPIASIIFQTGNTYANSVKARVRPADTGDYVDWRSTELAQGTAATSHSNLTNLSNDDHTQYLLLAGRAGDVTTVNVASYTMLSTDYTIHNTYPSTGAATVTLPTSLTTAGRQIKIKDASGNAGTNNITIATESTQTIDGAASLTMSSNYGFYHLYSDGTNWFAI